MIEGKNPFKDALQENADGQFAVSVARAIQENPLAISKPLKYAPGSIVLLKDMTSPLMNLPFKIQKGSAGIYLVESTDKHKSKLAICLEQNILPFN